MTTDIIEPEKWTCSANEALHISIAEPTKAVTFSPKFTYPIVGDSEQIFGYQDLRIDLAFDCLSLKPLLTYTYSKKLSDDIKPIEETFGSFLPAGDYVLKSESEWLDSIEGEEFTLPSDQIVHSYERKGQKYDIYKFKLDADDVGKKFLSRMQILTLLYIEAGSYIDLHDKGWELYTVYERNEAEGKPIFVGFCTCFKYWKFEEHGKYDAITDLDAEGKYRCRLSQIVVLPPFQGSGHGREVYSCIADEWIGDSRCVEITVEDPNEEFDDLRDKCDLERLVKSGLLHDIKALPISSSDKKALQQKLKLAKRQFDRVLEMGLFWLASHGEGSYIEGFKGEQSIRLLVKRRVYLANREGLDGLGDVQLVKSKLQEVYERVARDHKGKAAGISRPLKRARDTT